MSPGVHEDKFHIIPELVPRYVLPFRKRSKQMYSRILTIRIYCISTIFESSIHQFQNITLSNKVAEICKNDAFLSSRLVVILKDSTLYVNTCRMRSRLQTFLLSTFVYEQFEDTKGVIRSSAVVRQYNGHMHRDKNNTSIQQNTTHKTKDWVGKGFHGTVSKYRQYNYSLGNQ